MKKEKNYIIIKSTSNDNISGSEGEKGWVDYFVEFLKAGLSYQLDSETEFIFKNELDLITTDDFNKSDLIFYILSPAMVFASNINQDSAELEQAFNFDIPLINSKIKKVFKAPVKIEDLPLSLSTPTYYRFYDHGLSNESDYETFEGWNKFQKNDRYWIVFADVLLDTINALTGTKNKAENRIYISDKNRSYYHYRNIIKRELKAFNSEIFPDEDYSIEANYMEDPELFFLAKCDMALNFPDEFIEMTREERQKAFTKAPDLKRFIWFSPSEGEKPEKKAKYNELKVQLKPYQNIEAIESTIEELKEILKENISKLNDSDNEPEEFSKPIIYIISDSLINRDNEDINSAFQKINELFVIKIIDNVENVTDYRHLHYELLKKAEYFFILYYKNNLAWLTSITAEIKKAPGFRNEKEILGKYILYGENSVPLKSKVEDFQLIEKKTPEDITDVIQKLKV